MSKKLQVLKYLLADYLSAVLAWAGFYTYRKLYIENIGEISEIIFHPTRRFLMGIFFIPIFWLFLYSISGYYRNVFRKSRLIELGETILMNLIGSVIIFFSTILDDFIFTYTDYYHSFFALFFLQFVLTYIPRATITNLTISKVRNRKIGFRTMILGCGKEAARLYKDIENEKESSGFNLIGFIRISDHTKKRLPRSFNEIGDLKLLNQQIKELKVEEVLIAPEAYEYGELKRILNILKGTDVIIKVVSNLYESLTGVVKMTALQGVSLLEIKHELLPAWQDNMKRIFDISVSLLALILLIPVYIALAIGVRMSSPGAILYAHERIGRYGKPFMIYKFRSMVVDAEKNGPALSCKDDKRITPFGLFMRKTRLDELPQFYNVLIGDMSIVGPRPERQFFIDQIVKHAPQYYHLQKIRPGITSLGQVKYGYAESVEQMLVRMKYDLYYLENMSLYFDFKILIFTIKIVMNGVGK